MRVATAFAVLLPLASGLAAQAGPSAADRAVALHRIIFSGEPDGPATAAELEAMTELALAYRNGTGVAVDIELACGFAEVAAHSSDRLMPDTPTARRAAEARGLVCPEVPDITVAWATMGCPTFNLTAQTFVLGPSLMAIIDRSGIHLDTSAGRTDQWLGLTCGEIVSTIRHRRVGAPQGSRLPSRHFLEVTSWMPKFAHNGLQPQRTLVWRLIELETSSAEPARESLDLLVQPEWAWPTPSVPEIFADGAALRMLNTGRVQWRFDRAPELGAGTFEPEAR